MLAERLTLLLELAESEALELLELGGTLTLLLELMDSETDKVVLKLAEGLALLLELTE